MAFVSDYWHALDKQAAERLEVSTKDIGISHGAGDVLEGLQANIRAGASAVELGFTGTNKGSLSGGQTTPEMFGKDKREAMRQLSKVNEVVLSTHASVGVQGLSGLDPRQNAFTPEASEQSIHEIERTIDFAADVAGGGPVVIHGAEFPRPIAGRYKEFEMYEGEEKKAPVYLVNSRTGKIEAGLTRDTKLPIPVPERDEGGNIKKDDRGNPIPSFNEKTGKYEIKMMDFGEFKNEMMKDYPERAAELKDPQKAALEFYRQHILVEQLGRVSFEEKRWRHDYEREKKRFEYLKESVKDIKETEKKNPALAKFQAIELLKDSHEAPPPQSEEYLRFLDNPMEYLNKTVDSQLYHLKYVEDAAVSYAQQRANFEQQYKDIQPLEEYGKVASAKNLARAAVYAYDVEHEMGLKKPLFIAPENLFPESGYGGHPGELREVITDARKEMANRLVKERGMAEAEARGVAEEHIKATFDIGHAYTWKKFFKREEGESRADYDRRFNKWVLKQVDSLAKDKIIGHVHISDNFGYYDEHLTPGMGSAPLKEFVKKLKDAEITSPMIAEPGAQAQDQLFSAMTGAWGALVTSPIYRSFKWTDIEDSYFGRTASPFYIVGKYAPSDEYRGVEKGAPFWSGVPLE